MVAIIFSSTVLPGSGVVVGAAVVVEVAVSEEELVPSRLKTF